MKHLLSILLIFVSYLGFSQATAKITSPDATVCLGDQACLSSSTSIPGSSPIINSIWSATTIDPCPPPGQTVYAGNTAPGQNFCFTPLCPGTFDVSLINQHQNGTTSQTSIQAFISVVPGVVADISASVTSCTVPFGVQYGIGSSTGAPCTYAWTFQSGNPATFAGATPPIINYNTAGSYTVSMVVTNALTGCTATASKVINVSNFASDFTLPATVCEGTPAQLTDNSTIGVGSWSWSSSPGVPSGTASFNTSSSQNPTVTFSAPGTYNITLNSSNLSVPCNGTITKSITVLPKPTPSFTVSPLTGCSPLAVTLTNTSTGTAGATFSWNYGDTQTFNGQNSPIHTYTGNGSYTPTLTMTGSNGCVATASAGPIVLSSPVANFRVDLKDGCEGINITFTDISTAPAAITNWFWDFGDGTTSTLQNPIHTYTCGKYDVRLVIIATGGCRDTVLLSDGAIPFGAGYETSTSGGANLLLKYGTHTVPDFKVDHHNDCIKKIFKLIDLTPIACPHDATDIIRNWYLNGALSGNDSVFNKMFQDTMMNIGPNLKPGTDIWLEINFRNCKDTTKTEDSIYVSAPISKFSIPTVLFCDINQQPFPLSKTISINDSQSIYGHKWANNTIAMNPQILDSTVGNLAYDRTDVTFKWGDGTTDFYQTNAQGVLDNALTGIEDVGDGATNVDPTNPTLNAQTTANPLQHTFTNYGTYDVWQIIHNYNSMDTTNVPFNNDGCVDSTMVQVIVSWVSTDYVFDEFALSPFGDDQDSVCINNTFGMRPTGSTHNTHGPVSYSFNMDNGQTLTGPGTQTLFNSSYGAPAPTPPGVYNILLTTTNAVGCSATATGAMKAFALPIANFSLDSLNGCQGVSYPSNSTNNSSHPSDSYQAGSGVDWAANGFTWTINGGSSQTTSTLAESLLFSFNTATTVTLVATDAFGCVSVPFSVQANAQQPTAVPSVTAQVCNSVVTTGQLCSIGNGNPVTFIWTLDGVVQAPDTNPCMDFPSTWEVQDPATSGTHQIILEVFDALGCTDKSAAVSTTVINPIAAFTYDVTSTAIAGDSNSFNCPPVFVDFTDASISAGAAVTSWKWELGLFGTHDFLPASGAPGNSIQQNPQGMQYLFSGNYDLRYIITAGGCVDTLEIEDFIKIGGPSGFPTVSQLTDICGQTFNFELDSAVNVDHWYWEMGDGSTVYDTSSVVTGPNPLTIADSATFSYKYNGVGTYTPTVYLVDALGCTIPYTDSAIVLPNGVNAVFTAAPDSIEMGQTVTFDQASTTLTGNLITWIWDFGDGRIDTLTNGNQVSNVYGIAGEVPVTLIAIDDRGCSDDYTLVLHIKLDFDFPNVLTGDGSGSRPNKDLLLFKDVCKSFHITIVNRWGNVVHEGDRDAANPRYLWNGVDDKSGKLCQDGTYFYIFEAVLKNDVPVKLQGFITLIATERP